MTGYFIGLDLGKNRVGIALSDPTGFIAQPHDTIQSRSPEKMAKILSEIFKGKEIKGLVVGLPLNADGSEGKGAKEARLYAHTLAEALDLPLYLEDERYTTIEAEEALRESGMRWKKRTNAAWALAPPAQ